MIELKNSNFLKQFPQFLREVQGNLYAAREFIDGSDQKQEPAYRLLAKTTTRLDTAVRAAENIETVQTVSSWLRVPDSLTEAFGKDELFAGMMKQGVGPATIILGILESMPQSDDLSEALKYAVNLYRDNNQGKDQGKSNRQAWAEYLGTRQTVVARIGTVKHRVKYKDILLNNPTIHNGKVIPVDHLWVRSDYLEPILEKARTGDIISFSGRLEYYQQKKIHLQNITQVKIVTAGKGAKIAKKLNIK